MTSIRSHISAQARVQQDSASAALQERVRDLDAVWNGTSIDSVLQVNDVAGISDDRKKRKRNWLLIQRILRGWNPHPFEICADL